MRLKVEENKAQGPGHAIITALQPGVGSDGLILTLQRPGHEKASLGASGWQASDTFVPIDQVETIDGGLRIFVGPNVVQHMVRGNFKIKLTDGSGAESRTAVLSWHNVAPYRPAKRSGPKPGETVPIEKETAQTSWEGVDTVTRPKAETASPPGDLDKQDGGKPHERSVAEEPQEESIKASQPSPNQEGKPSARPMILIGAGLAMVVLVGAIVAFVATGGFESSGSSDDVPTPIIATPDPSADPRGFVRQYLVQVSDLEEMVKESKRLLANDAMEASIALLSEAAQRDFGPAALELGKLYDPSLEPEVDAKRPTPNVKTAYQYYMQAKQQLAVGAEDAVTRLSQWAERAADNGDRDAEKLLRLMELEN